MRCLALALLLLAGAAGCATVAPALSALAVAFGQDLVAAASVNHSRRYAVQIEELLIALANQATGLSMNPQLVAAGYRPPPPEYLRPQQPSSGASSTAGGYSDPYAQNDAYAQNDPYAQGDPYAQNDPYAQDDPYAEAQNDPYAQGDPYAQSDPYAQGDPYAQSDPYGAYDPYAQVDPYVQNVQGYAPDGGRVAPGPTRSVEAIELNVALLARRAGSTELEPVDDGAVLRDGGSDPASGDLLKVHFQTNCVCFVYIIGVDATGYVAQIFPDPDEGFANPVPADTPMLVPTGNNWWALDQYKGVEQVYFLASFKARQDVQALLDRMAGVRREVAPDSYQPVRQPAIVPATRGLVKVQARPVQINAARPSAQTVIPEAFSTAEPGTELVVTRWFHHE